MALGHLPETDLELTCPRCERVVVERFYGPCEACRSELRSSLGNDGSKVVAAEYEPKMNVVPNAIASKE